MSIKNDGHYFCRAGGNRPDGLNEPVTFSQYLKAMESGDWKLVETLRTKQKDLSNQQRETIGYWKEHGVVVKYEDQWDF
ncbi:hypothetical protein GEO09_22180 [Escherichia coli]|nr:hypothetical protein [Escherichia coli]